MDSFMSKRAWLWLVSLRSPDVRMHVSLTGVIVAVEHGQDVRHVAFPPLSFLCIFRVLVPALIPLCLSVCLSLVCVCWCFLVLFVCFHSCGCALINPVIDSCSHFVSKFS